MKKSRYFPLLIPLFLFMFAETVSASGEVRLKSDVDYAIPLKGDGSSLVLHPMLETEQRFRSRGLSKSKVFAGIRVNISPRIRIQGYYGYQENLLPDSKQDHRIVIDLTVKHPAGRFVCKERTRSEWRSNPGYFRFRQYLELLYHPIIRWVAPWASEEVRWDSDRSRIIQNDFQAGLDLSVTEELKFRLYYDLESKRRSSPGWIVTHVAGVVMVIQL